ncbi:MAG: two-component regulator propeller domain-containing protein [Bacteroidia bacterium]
MRKLLLLQVLVNFFAFSSAFAQPKQKIIFNHIGQKELEKASVMEMAQDDLGFIWLATKQGLCKYDGSSFRFIKHDADDTTSLESNNLNAIVKDKDGTIWIGSDGAGLYELDPYTEKFIQHKNPYKPMLTNRIRHLLIRGDEIYIPNYGGGLTVYNKKTKLFDSYLHDEKDPGSIESNTIYCVSYDSKGHIWLGTILGIDEFDPVSKKFTHHLIFGNQGGEHIVGEIRPISDDYFILSTPFGIMEYYPRTDKYTAHVHNEKDSSSVSSSDIRGVSFQPDGQVFVTTTAGLDITDSSFTTFTHYKNDPSDVYSLSNSRERNFIYNDKTGTIWIGSEYYGLDVIYPSSIKPKIWKHDSQNNNSVVGDNVFTLEEDAFGDIWAGTYGAGLSRFDRDKNEFINYHASDKDTSQLSNGLIYSVFREDKDHAWVLTENGMNKLNLLTGKVERHLFMSKDERADNPLTIRFHRTCKMIKDEKGNYWIIIIGGGLMHYEPLTGKITRYKHDEKDPASISDNRLFSIAYDKTNDILWLGTVNGGVNAFDLRTKKTIHFVHSNKNPNSITIDWAYTMVIDPKTNILWVGTDGGGLNATDLNVLPADRSKTKFYHFTEQDGLPDNNPLTIVPDGKNNIWIGSPGAICLFTAPSYLKGNADATIYSKGIYKVYHASNGLPFDGVTEYGMMLSQKDHRMYCSGEGFYAFDPDHILENKISPPIYISSFSLFNKPFVMDTSVFFKKRIVLSYDENFISFGFSILNYIFPERNKIEWKLEGLDKDWRQSTTERTAAYTNLDPGTYIFRVRGMNNDGYRNDKGASITIIITPPFWKTKWFYALVIIISISVIFFYIRWRERKLMEDKKILESTVTERTKELQIAYSQIEEKNKDITDSINYARRIQDAVLPTDEEITGLLPESFVLYKPKDIVSGDFYWFTEKNGKIIFAAVDCTGHGVPGAFMSLIGHNLLTEIINDAGITTPGKILDEMRKGVIRVLKQKGVSGENKDGMDISLCSFDKKTFDLEFAGAHNALWLIRKTGGEKKFEEIKADKQPIGISYSEQKPFTTNSLQLQKGDSIYIFTDGYADQFGGAKGKKFKYKPIQEILMNNNEKSMKEQHIVLSTIIDDWKKGLDQNDDILMIGVRV